MESKIRVISLRVTIYWFMLLIESNVIQLEELYSQHSPKVGDEMSESSDFIDLLDCIGLQIPFPTIYLEETKDQKYDVVKGVAALIILYDFIYKNSSILADSKFFPDTIKKNTSYMDLPVSFKRKILEYPLDVVVFKDSSPYSFKWSLGYLF